MCHYFSIGYLYLMIKLLMISDFICSLITLCPFNCQWIEKHRAKSTLPYSRWSYVKCTWLRLRAASGAPCRWLGTLPEALPLLLCNCHPGAGLCHLLSHPVPLRARILSLHHSARWVSVWICSGLLNNFFPLSRFYLRSLPQVVKAASCWARGPGFNPSSFQMFWFRW